MKNYLMTLQYDGSRYSGWQRQGNTDNTIEHKLSEVISRMVSGNQNIEIHGSGRTDAGVHAKGQMANFKLETDMTVEDIKVYLNKYLPEDIVCLKLCEVPERFHARLNANKKTYEYVIDTSDKADVFLRKYSWNIRNCLDVDSMRRVSEKMLGEHDFRGFSDMKKDKKSSIRIIYSIDIFKEDKLLKIRYTGNGFLYHMVRKLTAFLVDVGMGQAEEKEFTRIMTIADKSAYKKLAPAQGLTLVEVEY